jgi:ribosomal protein L40E
MSDNLYNKILGIKADIDSPNHYELLGLALFESNPRKVHRAGLRCLRKLKDWQLHPDPKTARAVQEMMNQVGLACTILELPEKKDDYDQQLSESLGVVPPIARPTQSTPRATQPEVIGDIRIIGLDERKVDHSKKAVPGAKAHLFELQKHLKICPHCNAQLSELAQICIDCGYSFTLDKVLKTSIGSRLTERIIDNFRLSGKAVFYIILLLLLAGIGYSGFYFYKEYGLGYWDYKIEISDSSLATSVRHEVRDSELWKICIKLAKESGRSRPFFVFELKTVEDKKQFKVNYGNTKTELYGVETTDKITAMSLKDQTAVAALETLSYLIKQKPENMAVLADNFKLLPENEKQKIFKFLQKEPEGIPLENLLFGVKIMIPGEKDEKMLAELTRFKELLEKKIEIKKKSLRLKLTGKTRDDFLSYFKYLSSGNATEKAAALTTLMRYPFKSSRKKRLNLLEIVIQSKKRSLEAKCFAAWMLAGFVGSKYQTEALEILEQTKPDAPEKLQNYIGLASQMFLYKLSDEGFVASTAGLVLVPVLLKNVNPPVLLDKPFMVSRYEISTKQYATVLKSPDKGKTSSSAPVVNVSWYDAVLYCRMVNEMESSTLERGYEFRLPTEKEFMAVRNAMRAGSLANRDAVAGEAMREWCLDYVNINRQGQPEENQPGKLNLKGKANLALGPHKGSNGMMSAIYPWRSAHDLGFRVVLAPEIKINSDYLDKKMGRGKRGQDAAAIGLYVLDNKSRISDDVPLDILMERGFAWLAPKGAFGVVQHKDGRTYKASGVQIFRLPNFGRTRLVWTGGRRFQWKALFKFNNGQETVRSGTGFKTCTFDIVLPRTEKYIIMQMKGVLENVYTDQVFEEKLVGKAKSLFSGRAKIDPDYDYIADLTGLAEKAVADDSSGIAWCMLKNAVTFGEDVPQLRRLLKNCSSPNLKNGPDAPASDRVMKMFSGNAKAKLSVLKRKTDLKHSQLEAAMLLDREVVGRGLFFTVGSKAVPDELFIFVDQNKLTIKEISRLYGKPFAEYRGPGDCRYLFYGRIFFCLVPGAKIPFIVRFNIANKEDGSYLKETRK